MRSYFVTYIGCKREICGIGSSAYSGRGNFNMHGRIYGGRHRREREKRVLHTVNTACVCCGRYRREREKRVLLCKYCLCMLR